MKIGFDYLKRFTKARFCSRFPITQHKNKRGKRRWLCGKFPAQLHKQPTEPPQQKKSSAMTGSIAISREKLKARKTRLTISACQHNNIPIQQETCIIISHLPIERIQQDKVTQQAQRSNTKVNEKCEVRV